MKSITKIVSKMAALAIVFILVALACYFSKSMFLTVLVSSIVSPILTVRFYFLLFDLERMLKNAEIVSDQSKSDEVGINNTVTLYMEDDDEEETYKIVTSIRGNSMKGHISTESPMGKALLGHKEGERVYIKVNDDFGYYVVIRKVIKTESEEDDQIRKF